MRRAWGSRGGCHPPQTGGGASGRRPALTVSTDAAARAFLARGFHIVYQSTAIRLLTHPEHPGVEVRIGTNYVVIERDGREIYRSLLADFRIEEALARLAR